MSLRSISVSGIEMSRMKTRSLVVERVMERSGSSLQFGQVALFFGRRDSSGRVGMVLEVGGRACWSGTTFHRDYRTCLTPVGVEDEI